LSISPLRVLVYGYGNPGRQDDGLGAALVSELEQAQIPNVDYDCNYQLNIEDADNISVYDVVIFADASLDAEEPFTFSKVSPSNEITFSTHAISAESVVALCSDIYEKQPDTYMIAIPGYEWELMNEGLTQKAKENLEAALVFMKKILVNPVSDDFKNAAKEKL